MKASRFMAVGPGGRAGAQIAWRGQTVCCSERWRLTQRARGTITKDRRDHQLVLIVLVRAEPVRDHTDGVDPVEREEEYLGAFMKKKTWERS